MSPVYTCDHGIPARGAPWPTRKLGLSTRIHRGEQERGTTTQQLGLGYREGPLSRGRAGVRVARASSGIHAGIPAEEYVAALKVLQHMIRNLGGRAWHH